MQKIIVISRMASCVFSEKRKYFLKSVRNLSFFFEHMAKCSFCEKEVSKDGLCGICGYALKVIKFKNELKLANGANLNINPITLIHFLFKLDLESACRRAQKACFPGSAIGALLAGKWAMEHLKFKDQREQFAEAFLYSIGGGVSGGVAGAIAGFGSPVIIPSSLLAAALCWSYKK
jgi:hypothetical protein